MKTIFLNTVAILSCMILLINGCCKKTPKLFRLPNGEMIKQTTVSDLEHQFKIRFEQYDGFVAIYGDSLLKEFRLVNNDMNKIIGADILSDKTINDLRSYEVETIHFSYTVKNKNDKIVFQNYIQKKYPRCIRKDINKDNFDLECKGTIICRIEFYDFAIPNYSVKILPAELEKF